MDKTDASADRVATHRNDDLGELEKEIGYRFGSRSLLERALTHRSHANECTRDIEDNEVLEFLGDAVLGLIVSDLLFRRRPYLTEGEMSKLKSFLVSAGTLGQLGDALDIGRFVFLGRGEEKTAGRAKASILANTLEALIAALYLDGGLSVARDFIVQRLEPLLDGAEQDPLPARDYKSALQEEVQARGLPLPSYRIVDEHGPDHDKVFQIEVAVAETLVARGEGKTKKSAEQRAARRVFDRLASPDEGG